MKIKILVVGIMLVLLTAGLSGCIDPCDIPKLEGYWTLTSYDWQGNYFCDQLVFVDVTNNAVTITDRNSNILFEGTIVYTQTQSLMKSSSSDPFDNPLTISTIDIQTLTYMESDMPLLEMLLPYTFTRFDPDKDVPDVAGDWTLTSYDWQGNVISSQIVLISISNPSPHGGVTITDYQPNPNILFKGTLEYDPIVVDGSQYRMIAPDPNNNQLKITTIYMHSLTYMESDLPLWEMLNPYKFTRVIERDLPKLDGTWTLTTYDWQGNVFSQKLVIVDVADTPLGGKVTIKDQDPPIILFEGTLVPQGSQYVIQAPSHDNLLTVSKIFILTLKYMVSDQTMIEHFNPYKFTRCS